MIARTLRTLACVATVAAVLPLDLAAQTRTPAPAPPPAPVVIPSTIDENARETRDRLRELLDQYPPSLAQVRSEEHTSELQSLAYLVCRLLLEKKKKKI